jgi:hypothetical protein
MVVVDPSTIRVTDRGCANSGTSPELFGPGSREIL